MPVGAAVSWEVGAPTGESPGAVGASWLGAPGESGESGAAKLTWVMLRKIRTIAATTTVIPQTRLEAPATKPITGGPTSSPAVPVAATRASASGPSRAAAT